MAEWSNALVLKTSVQQCTGGSNPSLSATKGSISNVRTFLFLKNIESGKKPDTDTIKKFAPNIVEGTKKLVDWSKSL